MVVREQLIICNGYKDSKYIETALVAQKFDKTVIIVLELVCFIPAVGLVWVRPRTTRTTKWVATAILVGIPVFATALDYAHNPGG